jgi:hypothetical protein
MPPLPVTVTKFVIKKNTYKSATDVYFKDRGNGTNPLDIFFDDIPEELTFMVIIRNFFPLHSWTSSKAMGLIYGVACPSDLPWYVFESSVFQRLLSVRLKVIKYCKKF